MLLTLVWALLLVLSQGKSCLHELVISTVTQDSKLGIMLRCLEILTDF